MAKNIQAAIAVFILLAGVVWTFYSTTPHPDLSKQVPENEFSTARAFEHVEALAQEPHYVGSGAHRRARNYIVSQLEALGLFVETQEGFSLNKKGILTRPQNIMARIQGSGNGKAVLLMSHYDSAVHSSPGASDAASGIATILEGLRAYLASGEVPKNDIIVLFTDAEELGLNGAELFVEEHPWAADVGIALNFESRGSGGTSFMLLETNGGNKALIDHFKEAGVKYPVTNSLAYSVYKMLPNDTDLTVLREQGDINGLNFAFIDDHFDYHTATDIPENLDLNTLAHQGSYLMPLLKYFSSVPVENLDSEENLLFFFAPGIGLVSYPYSWIIPMLVISGFLFLLLVGFGRFKDKLSFPEVFKGFLPLLLSLFLCGILSYFFWQLMLLLYPGYGEMEHGFTYNGYYYIAAAVFLSLTICFYVYHKYRKPQNIHELLVAPMFLWILIGVLAALYLKGAAYFIIPVFFALLQFALLLINPRFSPVVQALLCLPVIVIIVLFISSFPVALGLNMLFLSGILIALLFPLLWPVFGFFRNNQLFGFLCFLVFIALFVTAHFKSDFNEDRPRPNSLVYLYDVDRDIATWHTYDKALDAYTAPFFEQGTEDAQEMYWFGSKNGSRFSFTAPAPKIKIQKPFISVEKTTPEKPGEATYNVKIAPNRDISRISLFTERAIDFSEVTANGEEAGNLQPGRSDLHVFKNRWNDRLLTYYAVNRDTLRLEMTLEEGIHPEITLLEASYNLHDNPQLKVPLRTQSMIPRPFVMNDAIVVKETFVLE